MISKYFKNISQINIKDKDLWFVANNNKVLFSDKNRNLILNSNKEGRFDEKIETKVEYYNEIERVGYPWGRNLVLNSNFKQGLEGFRPYTGITDVFVEDEVLHVSSINSSGRMHITQRIKRIDGQPYTISLLYSTEKSNPSTMAIGAKTYIAGGRENGTVPLQLADIKHLTSDLYLATTTFITNRDNDIDEDIWFYFYPNDNSDDTTNAPYTFIHRVQAEMSDIASKYSPAPEDLSNLKGTKYNLSTTLKKDQYYTLSVDGNFNEDDFIGVFLGNNKFIGYLQDNKITFKSNIDIDDDYIVVKSLSEEGKIRTIQFEEGDVATEHNIALEDIGLYY